MEGSHNVELDTQCFKNLTEYQKYTSVALSGVCFISLLISIPVIALTFHEYCIKNRVSDLRTERLILYLVCGSGVTSMLGCFEWIGPLSINSTVAEHGCSALGFLLMLALLFTSAIILCMGIHFIIQMCKPKALNILRENRRRLAKRLEVFYLCGSLSAAILLSPWPWIQHMFGYNEWICWMVLVDEDCRPTSEFTAVKVVFYGILLIVALFSFCVMISVHVLICLRKRNINNIDVWAYSIFIVFVTISLVIILVVTLLEESPGNLHLAKTISLGVIPLNVSTITLIAVIYKKYVSGQINNIRRAEPRQSRHDYQSTADGDPQIDSVRLKMNGSRVSTTHWEPPATHTSSTSNVLVSLGKESNKMSEEKPLLTP